MRYVIISLVFAVIGPSFSFAESGPGTQDAAFETRGVGFRGSRGRGSRFRGKGYAKGHRFHRRGRTRKYYYFYSPYYGPTWKFYPREDRSFYPHQGGSDYRDWFYFQRR